MKRLLDLVLVASVLAGAVWTYQIKHEAELSAKHIDELQAKIRSEDQKIALLEADWAISTAPSRLEKVAKKFGEQLGLEALSSSQIIDLTELPAMRVERDDAMQSETYAEGEGAILTGGIGELIERESN